MTFAEIAMLLNCASFRWRVIVMRRLHKKKSRKKKLRIEERNGKSRRRWGNIVREKRSIEKQQKERIKDRSPLMRLRA